MAKRKDHRGTPRFLLMDEPSEGFTPLRVRGLADTLKELKAHSLSILLVEQNLYFALGAAEQVQVLNKGKIVYSASPRELLKNEEVKHRYLGV